MTAAPLINLALVLAAGASPFAAGLCVVGWSRYRAAARQRALATVDLKVRELYRQAEDAPIPVRLAVTVEAVAEHEEMAAIIEASRPRFRAFRTKVQAS